MNETADMSRTRLSEFEKRMLFLRHALRRPPAFAAVARLPASVRAIASYNALLVSSPSPQLLADDDIELPDDVRLSITDRAAQVLSQSRSHSH